MKLQGELEIDEQRGVIWFHENATGQTLLRICSLPAPIPDPTLGGPANYRPLDVTYVAGAVSWRKVIKE